MKKQLLSIAILVGSLLAGNAQAQTGGLVHYWNFNNTINDTLPTNKIHASYSAIDTNTANVWYTTLPGTSSAYSSFYDPYTNSDSTGGVGENTNGRFGDCVCSGIRLRNPSDSMQLLTYMPMNHYQNPVIKYVVEASSNGMRTQFFDYSSDSGATWRTEGLSMTVDSPLATSWSLITVNINSTTDTTVRNNGAVVFRIRFGSNNTGTAGNDRMDNMTVEADTFIAVSPTDVVNAVAGATNVYTLYPNPVANILNFTADADGAKSIMIRTADGRTAFAGVASGKKIALDISTLAAGTYFVTVKEATEDKASTMKFIKE